MTYLPKIPYIHRIYIYICIVVANPTYITWLTASSFASSRNCRRYFPDPTAWQFLPKMLLGWFRWKKEEKDTQAVISHSPHNKEKYKMVPSIVKLLYHENGGSYCSDSPIALQIEPILVIGLNPVLSACAIVKSILGNQLQSLDLVKRLLSSPSSLSTPDPHFQIKCVQHGKPDLMIKTSASFLTTATNVGQNHTMHIFIYVRYTNGIIGREIIKDTVIYGVHIYGSGRP